MNNPAGVECRFYYEDFNRGREIQTCRLISSNIESRPWQPGDCSRCTVPAILRANGSPHLQLALTKKRRFLVFGNALKVTAHCQRHGIPIAEPRTGCVECRIERGTPEFVVPEE